MLLAGYEGNEYNVEFYGSQFTCYRVLKVIKSRKWRWSGNLDRRSKYMQQFVIKCFSRRPNCVGDMKIDFEAVNCIEFTV